MVRNLYRTNYWKFLKREIICLVIFNLIGIAKSLSCVVREGTLVMATCTFEEMFMKDLGTTKPQPAKRPVRANIVKPNTATCTRSHNKSKCNKLDKLYKKYGLISAPPRQSKVTANNKKVKDQNKKSPSDAKKVTNQNLNPSKQITNPSNRSLNINAQKKKHHMIKTTKLPDYAPKTINAAEITTPLKNSTQIVKLVRASNVVITRRTQRTEREKQLAYIDVLNAHHLGANATIDEDVKTGAPIIQTNVNWLTASDNKCTLCDWEGSKYMFDNHYLEYHCNRSITDEKYFDALM